MMLLLKLFINLSSQIISLSYALYFMANVDMFKDKMIDEDEHEKEL